MIIIIMKRRKQNQLPQRNNQTLDSFMSGLSSSRNRDSSSKSTTIPKIKVPGSSGLEPINKPLKNPFMYPNYPQLRDYQYSIAIKCVTQNTMVSLPTGLGKTHIASVLMLNFHLWFPENLIFFLAPTKPLVNQQSMCLSQFSHIVPPNNVLSLTGSIPQSKRRKSYSSKRIFFCTPQTIENDLVNGILDPKRIILIIFDQAHKATGNYAYANIVRFLQKQHFGYRIVGLSATPGNDNTKIQEVIQNLNISTMIIKNDEDPDVKKYIKNKQVQPIFIQNTSIIRETEQILKQYIDWALIPLLKLRLFNPSLAGGKYGFNPNCFFLINQQINQKFNTLPIKLIQAVNSARCLLKFVSDSQHILRDCGYESFKQKFIYVIDEIEPAPEFMQNLKLQGKIPVMLKKIKQHEGFQKIKQLFQASSTPISHPKLQKLRQILYSFLSNQQNIQKKSKVIVFANFRSTCHEIYKYLSLAPYGEVIKCEIFLGQAKTTIETREGESSRTETLSLTQKEQIRMIRRYKNNEINTLISTSIGEEGLDIGEVDAIFCYDGGMSNIRMIQRMGRTGRKRDGNVYVLLMEGKQSEDYANANKKTARMKKTNSQKFKYYSYNPVLFEQFSQIPIKFFDKPEQPKQVQISQNQSSQNEQISSNSSATKDSQTKKKKNKTKKGDGKKTKKKKLLQSGSKIQQVSNSQQNDEAKDTVSNSQYELQSQQKQQNIINNSKCFTIKNGQCRFPTEQHIFIQQQKDEIKQEKQQLQNQQYFAQEYTEEYKIHSYSQFTKFTDENPSYVDDKLEYEVNSQQSDCIGVNINGNRNKSSQFDQFFDIDKLIQQIQNEHNKQQQVKEQQKCLKEQKGDKRQTQQIDRVNLQVEKQQQDINQLIDKYVTKQADQLKLIQIVPSNENTDKQMREPSQNGQSISTGKFIQQTAQQQDKNLLSQPTGILEQKVTEQQQQQQQLFRQYLKLLEMKNNLQESIPQCRNIMINRANQSNRGYVDGSDLSDTSVDSSIIIDSYQQSEQL